MTSSCNQCYNLILRQPFLICSFCNAFFHKRCVNVDVNDVNWLCMNCSGEIFPFNHYIDDDEFNFALHTFNSSVDYNKLLSLKFNPFVVNDMLLNNDDLHNYNVLNKCS